MNRRKRSGSVASRNQDDDDDSSSTSSVQIRKRKKIDPAEVCQQLYDIIRSFKKEDGSLLCDAFIRAPKRRQEPSYYDVVTNAIDLLRIQQKLKTDEYEDIEELTADIELLVSNTKAFYKRQSQEYKDACELLELYHASKNRILDPDSKPLEDSDVPKNKAASKTAKSGRKGGGSHSLSELKKQELMDAEENSETSTNPDEDMNQYEELFVAVMYATDHDNRPLHVPFQLLPSKKKYPEYYDVIEKPIDLKTIAMKIQSNEYTSLNQMEKDLLLMFKNATSFNEPGSKIYKDAKALKKVVSVKKNEIEHGKSGTNKSSERIRNKRLRGTQCLSAVTAALKYDETDSEEELDEEDDEETSSSPLWQLFNSIKNATTSAGTFLIEPFLKLPSRRYFRDYYRQVKNPISFTQIRKKLWRGGYGTVSELACDLNLMIENVKKTNYRTSQLHKDAIKVQKLVQSKVHELLNIYQESETDEEDSSDCKLLKKKQLKAKNYGALGRGRPPKESTVLRKKMQHICTYLSVYTIDDGRIPMLPFFEKPSAKLYPEYYEIINEPIDLMTIESKVKSERYQNEDEFLDDFKLMFSNCRTFNEEGSRIYEDSILLEKVLNEKMQKVFHGSPKIPVKSSKVKKDVNEVDKKLRLLYDTIKDYKEPRGNRQLSQIFMKLPSKNDYPDYYEVIKTPIDMERILSKIKTNLYDNLEELVTDFMLMFDNACKYNEPDSQIYKDALILQRICVQTKLQLKDEDDETMPDVASAVQEILSSLFTIVYNHEDEAGRCYSDSMAEVPEYDETDGKKIRMLSLDVIKRRLDRGVYKRLDLFQDDFFRVLSRARHLSRTDSQIFEDSIELQSYFIRQRDEICRSGELLQSPALLFTINDLIENVETLRQEKLQKEQQEDQQQKQQQQQQQAQQQLPPLADDPNLVESNESLTTSNEQTYRVGEYVYLNSEDKDDNPTIICIDKLWTNEDGGQQMCYGCIFLYPRETYHVPTRKFLEKEVFKTETYTTVPLSNIRSRCSVLNIRDYLKYKPEGYADEDIYVCEFRYVTRQRTFKKLKGCIADPELTLLPREVPLEPKRVLSVFRERVEKHKDELAELDELEKIPEAEKPNVVMFPANIDSSIDETNTFYEQYNTIISGVVKTGDFIYVATSGGRQMIAQIDMIWETKDGKCMFRGPWLITPPDITRIPNQMFFKQELFLSTIEDCNPIVSIVGKCAVLELSDYISWRPTEIPEADIYVCTSVYDETARQMRKLPPEGLKRYTHSPQVSEDEIYYFPRLINPQKIHSPFMNSSAKSTLSGAGASGATAICSSDVDLMLEDSLDEPLTPSIASDHSTIQSNPGTPVPTTSTTGSSKKKNSEKKKQLLTGYIVYSREVRKKICQQNQDKTFAVISKLVGTEWRTLPNSEKMNYEEKAARFNEQLQKRKASMQVNLETGEQTLCGSTSTYYVPHADFTFQCLWDTCDFQFEDVQDLADHCFFEGTGHIYDYYKVTNDPEFQCRWKNCMRVKKNIPPFPTMHRLHRHVREIHINKGNGKIIPPAERSSNFVTTRRNRVVQPQKDDMKSSIMREPAQSVSNPTQSSIVSAVTASNTNSAASAAVNASISANASSTSLNQATAAVATSACANSSTLGNSQATANTNNSVAKTIELATKSEPLFVSVPPRPQRLLHSDAYVKYIEGLNVNQKYISPWDKTLNATLETTPTPDPDKLANVETWLGNGVGNHGSTLKALWALRKFMMNDSLNLYKSV